MADDRSPFLTHGFSLVVVRNIDGRWLAVKQTRNRGWWLPAGLVDRGQTFILAAHREVKQQAGIEVQIKGLLRVEHSVYGPTHARMRVIFFGVPLDPSVIPKQYPNQQSEQARWVTLDQLKLLSRQPPGLRGPELYEWGNYIQKGGMIAPIHFLCRQDASTPGSQPSFFRLQQPLQSRPDLPSLIQAIQRGDDQFVRTSALSGVQHSLPINQKLWTVLHLACRLDRENAVYFLLLAGADPTAVTHKGRNVVHFAAQARTSILSMVLTRLSKFINKSEILNYQDAQGETALHFAANSEGNWAQLVSHGANPSVRNQQGLSAEDLVNKPLEASYY